MYTFANYIYTHMYHFFWWCVDHQLLKSPYIWTSSRNFQTQKRLSCWYLRISRLSYLVSSSFYNLFLYYQGVVHGGAIYNYNLTVFFFNHLYYKDLYPDTLLWWHQNKTLKHIETMQNLSWGYFFTRGTEQLVTTTKIPNVRPMSCGCMVCQHDANWEIFKKYGKLRNMLGTFWDH